MLKSNKTVAIGARIVVHAHNSTHFLVKNFVSSASSFNKKKLLIVATCIIEKQKPGAMPRDPRLGE